MPGCAVHLELASRVLDDWRNRGNRGPFDLDDPGCRGAFLFGSLAPDLGYFPGGDPLLADLSHCIRPVKLARSLIASAVTDVDRALAWGWVTHVLGDVWIHPLINQAAGERVCGERVPGLTFADDPLTHVRVELGLDAILPAVGRWPDRQKESIWHSGANGVAALTRAYRDTYGFTPSAMRMRITHGLSASVISSLLLGGRVFSGRPASAPARWTYGAVSGLARRMWHGRRIEAFTNPFPPPDWLTAEAGAVVDSFAARLQPYYESGLVGLPEHNLDTGQVEDDPPVYTLSIAALAKLEQRLRSHASS